MKKICFLLYVSFISLFLLVGCAAKDVEITGQQVVGIGETITLEVKTSSNEPIVWRSSNKEVATVSKGVVTGVSAGEVTIYVTCGKAQASIKIKVVGEQQTKDEVDPYQDKALEIISTMSLEQKVGELFILTIDGELSNSVKRQIRNFNIGNVLIMPNKDATYQELVDLVKETQSQILSNNVVPGFVFNTKDQATYKLLSSLATIPSSITILASNNEANAYKAAYVLGSELRSFGFASTFNPNMLLNDENESSYLDDPEVVSKYCSKEIDGYSYAGVMGVACTFPGGGEARWDTMPINGKSMDALRREDILPFLDAFENGLDALMASSVIFTVFDNTYPATLSYPVITTMLREELDYKGLVISNYLDDELMIRDYRSKQENVAVLAINAGVDMLTYKSTTYIEEDFNAILSAIKAGQIEEARIDEALLRIMLKKYKYDLLEDNHYMPAWNASEYDVSVDNQSYKEIVKDSIAILSGELPTLDKSSKILVASPIAQSNLGVEATTEEENSFAYILYLKLISEGYTDVEWASFDPNDRWEMNSISRESPNYDLVIFAISNVDWRMRLSFADNGLLVSLSLPIDISRVSGMLCYISAYGYEKENVDAFIDCLLYGAKLNDYRPQNEEDE